MRSFVASRIVTLAAHDYVVRMSEGRMELNDSGPILNLA